jgi:uncharacterized membrane protein
MTHEAIFWTLLTTVASGFFVLTSKVVAHKKLNPSANTIIAYSVSFVLLLCIYLKANIQVPQQAPLILFFAVCGGVFYVISFLTRIHSLKYIDSVLFLPINKILGPIVVVIGSIILFQEKLTQMQIIGVLFSICVPMLLINNKEKQRQSHLQLGIILLVISTIFGAVNNFFPKATLNFTDNLMFYYVWQQLAMIVFAAGYYLYHNYKNNLKFKITKYEFNFGILTGILTFLTVYTWMRALEVAPLSLLYTIHAHYILIPIIFSVFYYKEHIDFKKALAVVLSMIAIAFLI